MIDKFLTALGITGPEQDEVDIEYLQEVHWELWEKLTSRLHHEDPLIMEPLDTGGW